MFDVLHYFEGGVSFKPITKYFNCSQIAESYGNGGTNCGVRLSICGCRWGESLGVFYDTFQGRAISMSESVS
jgi:hypothetical protein